MSAPGAPGQDGAKVSILPLLKRLWPEPDKTGVTAQEIAEAISLIFTHSLSDVQAGALLTCLHFTGWDRRADVLSRCAQAMCEAAAPHEEATLHATVLGKGLAEGGYEGGLCDIVGTGGDGHNTYNVSTTAAIVASAYLGIAKHGNTGSTSSSGSADLMKSMRPVPANLEAVVPARLPEIYTRTNFAFLFAKVFHPGMRNIAAIRRELGWRTIFNLLGPLSNPLDATGASDMHTATPSPLEARVIGVARRDIGYTFADALRRNGSRKALVVCGDEDLDEISPAGSTHCWMLKPDGPESDKGKVGIEYFELHPSDFGLPRSTLRSVSPGKNPDDNAAILRDLLDGRLDAANPILGFVLMNAAALLVVSGICEAEGKGVISERGPGGGRWKEGVRRARLAIEGGKARTQWEAFVEVTNSFGAPP